MKTNALAPRRGSRRRFPNWLLDLGLVMVSVTCGLGLVELGLRATGQRALYEIYSKPSLFWRYDPLLGWAHEPNARASYVGPRPWPIEFEASVSINSLGLRGPEIPPASPGEARVLFLGDSMVAAFEVAYEESFVARVGEILGSRVGRPVRTISAGVRGYGTDQSYLYYRDRGRLLRPDVVVLYHSGNDPTDNLTLHEMRRPFGKPALRPASGGALELVNSPVPEYGICSEVSLGPDFEVQRSDGPLERALCRAQMALFDHSALFSLATIAVPWDADLLRNLYYVGNPHLEKLTADRDRGLRASDPRGHLTTTIVSSLAELTKQDGASLLVVGEAKHLVSLDRVELQGRKVDVEEIQSVVGKEQLEVRWRHDSHFNPEGHRIVAEELSGWIEPLLRARLAERGPGA